MHYFDGSSYHVYIRTSQPNPSQGSPSEQPCVLLIESHPGGIIQLGSFIPPFGGPSLGTSPTPDHRTSNEDLRLQLALRN